MLGTGSCRKHYSVPFCFNAIDEGSEKMRKYYLASSEDRGDVDLRLYQKEITAAVRKYMPGHKLR